MTIASYETIFHSKIEVETCIFMENKLHMTYTQLKRGEEGSWLNMKEN